MNIEDGKGSGRRAEVGIGHRLHTHAVTTTGTVNAAIKSLAYNLNTGTITLTNAVDTPVIYFKNNEDIPFVVTSMAVGIGESDGTAAEEVPITVVRNPTVGTIITSTPTNVAINQNRNFGSNRTLTADVYKGATGDTMTDGNDVLYLFASQNARLFAGIDMILPKGTSIGVKIDPPTSNTGMAVYVALIGYLDDDLE